MADGKTEKATPKKKEDERKKGNIFQSKDLTNILGLLAIISVLLSLLCNLKFKGKLYNSHTFKNLS